MRLVTFSREGARPEAGLLRDDQVISYGLDMLELCALGQAPPPAGPAYPLSSVKLLAPVPRPPKLICVGLNYAQHAAETNAQLPPVPTIFSKFSNVVIASGDPIVIPKASHKPDYEAELGVIIGKGGRNIPAARAMEHVFGYTVINDVSARDFQMATSQWLMGKTCDTFCPMGPCLVTADELTDPHNLDISTEIAGEFLQNSNTRHLIFSIPRLIEYVSSVVTLEPGDVFATGTPEGVGMARNPPRWLKPGEEVIVTIQGIGQLRNPVVAEV